MATDHSFVDYIQEQASLGAGLTCRKMFGEYALYLHGTVVAFVCDNSLFIKPSAALAVHFPEAPMGPAYPGSKDYAIADALLDEPERLRALLLASQALLPPPKPKKPKSSKKSKTTSL